MAPKAVMKNAAMAKAKGKANPKAAMNKPAKAKAEDNPTVVLLFGGAYPSQEDLATFGDQVKLAMNGEEVVVYHTRPGDLVGGDWYSQYMPLEKDIVHCLDHYGSSMESAFKKASDYSHHVVDTKWEQPAMAWARGVLAGHLGIAFKLIVIGISIGGIVAFSICQAFPELQPRLWLASAPPASLNKNKINMNIKKT